MRRLQKGLLVALTLSLTVAVRGGAVTSGESRSYVDSVVIHTIGGPECTDAGVSFTSAGRDAEYWKAHFEGSKYGIHWIVDRSGTALASVPETQIANHAEGVNASSIGIELVNKGDGLDPFPEEQIDALSQLICSIRGRWPSIPLTGIRGHGELDQRKLACGFKKKVDPGPAFPWSKVLDQVTECATRPPPPVLLQE